MDKEYKHIYGPVYSWRLGKSLGIDPISQKEKVCNFDCVYCQLGETETLSHERKIYVPTEEIVDEIKDIGEERIDFLTFSGRGEPTLAKNLGEMIKAIKMIRGEKIAVITNAGFIYQKDVQEDLSLSDFVLLKLDAFDQKSFQLINRPADGIQFDDIVQGLAAFRKIYDKRLALQIMFINGNKEEAEKVACIAEELDVDEIEINTPLRPSSASPLDKETLGGIKKFFDGTNVKTVYEIKKQTIDPMNEEDTIKRHGNFRKE